MNIRTYKTVKERREALEKELSVNLKHVGSYTLDESVATTRNCENMIGVAQIPMGIAGPLRVLSHHASHITHHDYYIPLATTEGALIASVNRGCKAITESGGVTVRAHKAGTTRGPVFRVANIQQSAKFYQYILSHIEEMREIARTTSHHLTLTNVTSDGVGLYRFVRFVFDTKDAMGMNMVTIATDLLSQFLEKETGATCLSIAGNYDIDKKPAWLNTILHRGYMVWAEAYISQNILQHVLKVSAKEVYDVWLAKCMIGSAVSGSLGFNAQYANILAALFLATGQDIAHVGEGSCGITTCEVTEDGLYISIYLPDCMIGTVGGGTGLATQQEALSLLGVAGGKDGQYASELAEIVGGAVLAGELSLLSSLAEGSLTRAHQALGRGKK